MWHFPTFLEKLHLVNPLLVLCGLSWEQFFNIVAWSVKSGLCHLSSGMWELQRQQYAPWFLTFKNKTKINKQPKNTTVANGLISIYAKTRNKMSLMFARSQICAFVHIYHMHIYISYAYTLHNLVNNFSVSKCLCAKPTVHSCRFATVTIYICAH